MREEEIKEAPRGSLNVLRYIGPGIVLSGAVIGSGELLVTTRMGAQFGYIFLWGVVLCCIIKYFVQIELGRFCINEKLLESAETYLKELVARRPKSKYADEARALLCRIYLKKNDFARVKQTLHELAKSPNRIKPGNQEKLASDYAREMLKLPQIARADWTSPSSGLSRQSGRQPPASPSATI